MDTLETLFLACFAFGALFTVGSVVMGAVGGLHFRHGGLHVGGHVGGHGAGHLHSSGADAFSGGHPAAAGHTHAAVHAQPGSHAQPGGHSHAAADDQSPLLGSLPLFNPSSALGFLTWFGAAGYLLVRYAQWAVWWVVLGAVLAGVIGWYLIARFLRLVLAGEREMDPDDYRLEGTVGRISVSVPVGGTGEVIFSKAGARRSEAARGLGGRPIPRGTEVVITAYEDGFATVQPWNEFLAVEKRQSV